MPGITFVGRTGGNLPDPRRVPYLLANSLNGAGTPPAAQLQPGDFVALTTASALTTAGAVVVRMLLAADRTAVYKEGTPVAGILGICTQLAASTSAGAPQAPTLPGSGGVIYSIGSENPVLDPLGTGRGLLNVVIADDTTLFQGTLAVGPWTDAMVNTLGGITFSTTSGVTTYKVNNTDTGTQACIRFVSGVPTDTTQAIFQIVSSFQQYNTGVDYSSQ